MDTSLDITRALSLHQRVAQGLETPTQSYSSNMATQNSNQKQISNLLTLASTQHGNTLRIENSGSTSWKPLRPSLEHARNDDDDDDDDSGL